MRARLLAALGLTAATVLAGCGDDTAEKPDFSASETPALWNPCDALDTDWIAAEFGVETKEHNGTATEPECRFRPANDGDAVITAEYVQFVGSLEDAWERMAPGDTAVVRTPEVEGADDARVVVDRTSDNLSLTGFVETGDLIQIVNVVDPAPYDAPRLERGVSRMLGVLSDHAVEAGVKGSG